MNKPKTPGDGKKSSYLELLAQERNLKRRRAKYRGVHTNKKSQVEILRDVISQQMEMLGEYISEKNDEPTYCATNNVSNQHITDSRSGEIRKSDNSMRNDYSTPDDSNERQYKSWYKKKSEDRCVHRGSSNDRGYDRGYDRGNNDSRGGERRNGGSKEKKKYSRERSRENSRDERSHKSSHKIHRDKSDVRHGERHARHGSRERDKSRLSRDSRYDDRKSESSRDSKYDERRSESSRDSKYNERRKKKRRRSRDR